MLSQETFNQSLRKLLQNPESSNFLLAVSGGADSMVLLQLFFSLKLKFQVAHVNYHLRGEDSNADQELVRNFCMKNEIPFHLYDVSEKDEKPENSIQNWARNLRYDFFRKIQKDENLDYLVTAHHLNDELETFLINLSRGSGIKGLSGIPANENQILRPLLNFTKDEIYAFAKENQVEFREDLSNRKNDYLRNSFRNLVIPEIMKTAPNFLNSFRESVHYLREADDFIQDSIKKSLAEITLENNDSETILNRKKFALLEPFMIKEIIRKFGFSGEEIGKIIAAENGKMFRSKTHELHIKRNEILCVKRN